MFSGELFRYGEDGYCNDTCRNQGETQCFDPLHFDPGLQGKRPMNQCVHKDRKTEGYKDIENIIKVVSEDIENFD